MAAAFGGGCGGHGGGGHGGGGFYGGGGCVTAAVASSEGLNGSQK